jgi:hypothetical protein
MEMLVEYRAQRSCIEGFQERHSTKPGSTELDNGALTVFHGLPTNTMPRTAMERFRNAGGTAAYG